MRIYLICLLLYFYLAELSGQSFKTKAITTSDGLSQGYINVLFQDSRGYIWIGTPSGLNRYDGYEIKSYSDDDQLARSLGATSILSIIETTDGLLWLGTSRGLVVFNPDTDQVVQVYDYLDGIAQGAFESLDVDDNGNIWFLDTKAVDKQLFIIRPALGLKDKINSGKVSISDFALQTITYASSISQPIKQFHITANNLIFAIDSKNQVCQINTTQFKAKKTDICSFNLTKEGSFGLIPLRASSFGLIFKMLSDTMSTLKIKDYRYYIIPNNSNKYSIRFGENKLYGLTHLDQINQSININELYFYEQQDTIKEFDAALTESAVVDQLGNIWLGTNGYGVRVLYRDQSLFEHSFTNLSISNMALVSQNNIWPGSFRSKYIMDISTDSLKQAPWLKDFPDKTLTFNYFNTSYGDEWLLCSTPTSRYSVYHKKKSSPTWIRTPLQLAHFLEAPVLFYEHSDQSVWIFGNMGELYRYQPSNQQFEQWNIRNKFIPWQQDRLRSLSVIADANDAIWVGVTGGLIHIERASTTPAFRVYHNYDKQEKTTLFSNDELISLYNDALNPAYLWIGTRGGGLLRFDKKNQRTKVFNTRDGLLNNVVYSILPDTEQRLWISTNKGISIFYPDLGKFVNPFSPASDISTEFNTNAALLLPDGRMGFGSVNGLFVLTPKAVRFSFPITKVALSGIKINGTTLGFYKDPRISIRKDNAYQLQVPHDQNNISLSFAALPVSTTNDILYRYRIPTLQQDWVDLGTEHTINLTTLPYGYHTIQLQSSMIIGNWSAAPITNMYIHIIRPWYVSVPAIIFYSILALTIAFIVYTYYRNKLVTESTVRASQLEAERLKMLDEFKNKFFAYVAHEFKTPLTVILGMTQRLKQYPVPDNITESLSFQANNLNELVSQLIDIGKSERKTLQLETKQLNISQYTQYIVESLRQLAEPAGITLHFESSAPDLVTDIDPIRLKYILNNLLTNAFRHTPEGGKVDVKLGRANSDQLLLTISDNGEGIPAADLPFIFERHYQGQSRFNRTNSFGLGLAFVKELIFLFNGDIDVQSKPSIGTTFTITLPIIKNASPDNLSEYPSPVKLSSPSIAQQLHDELPIILVVEDNPSISTFLHEALIPHFNVLQANNGRTGYEMAVQHLPDIILTDLIMPIMDGFQLTEQVKQNVLTSHIPVVMISAQAALEQRLSSHHIGVDAFVPKPFHEQELVLILLNMITLQQRWKERYAPLHHDHSANTPNDKFFSEHEQPALKSNDLFMDNLYAVFETNFSDEDFDRDSLCHELHISKSQLHRKLSAISALPAMELLRKFRLDKAYALIEINPNLQIREICFMIGMKHPAHFTSLFTQQFGISPSEFKKLTQLRNMST
jgi:signal transduction histidine kinase/DNA-binding response OmpR family regulator/ligand-binding sensor domain-containing protein